ncbi:hypothetical protein [Xenorhabdus sp. SGI240]|uniref:hypothetical protein n=1 Tax=Xenorhabdus sp. SGI240 TaxID=3158262 RepID=UPI0032B787E0
MCESGDYFFFAINPNQEVTAFRAQLQNEDLARLRRNPQRFGDTHCTPEEYNATVKNPDPPGQVMQWIFRNNWAYLDLEKHALELHQRGDKSR